MSDSVKKHLTSSSTWVRAFFLVLFSAAFVIAEIVVAAIMIFQLGSKLFTGKINDQLVILGKRVSTYVYQIKLFLTYNTEQKPFPFDAWPKAEVLIPAYAINTPADTTSTSDAASVTDPAANKDATESASTSTTGKVAAPA